MTQSRVNPAQASQNCPMGVHGRQENEKNKSVKGKNGQQKKENKGKKRRNGKQKQRQKKTDAGRPLHLEEAVGGGVDQPKLVR